MSEIRNLTRNGETFYPLTVADAVSDPNGEFFGYYEDNPEWIRVILDNDKKVLAGIKADGSVEWSLGVPQPIKDYVQENIIPVLTNKVDKEEGKSLIDSEYADGISYQDNPEFIDVELDNEGKVLGGIQSDGTKIFGSDVRILGSLDIDGVTYRVVENLEWAKVIIDSNGKIICGINTSGKFVVFSADFLDDIESIKARLNEFEDIGFIENPEFISVELDANNKVLGGRKIDGTRLENAGIEIGGSKLNNIEDPEGRLEIKQDDDQKILSYRDSKGVLHENAGVKTTKLELTEQGMSDFQQALKDSGFNIDTRYNLPKYGIVNIKQETFYLTKGNYTDKDDLEVRQELPDTDETAAAGLTIAHYYIKNTNTRLDFYAAGKVTKIEDKYYVISSLENGQVVPSSIEVTQIIDKPDVRTWPVDKKTEHYCLVDIDFGYYLIKSDISIGVKFQGSSTLYYRKRNFRFTFYKSSSKPYYPVDDDKFGKKDKIKIGELLRLSGFNLKSNWTDDSRIKELILYRIFINVWENRPDTDRFPWDKEFGFYTGATGTINGFQIKTLIGGDFYGLQTFGLKKDEKNYMLDGDDDSSGIFVSGTRRDSTCWITATASDWEDEMMDEMSQSTADALNTFFAFINNRLEIEGSLIEFNRENIPERMDVLGWIDYFINMQLFVMHDSICRNMILHTRSDKKKFYPYFYDVDLSLRRGGFNANIFEEAYDIIDGQKVMNDMSLWENFIEIYWDDIVNRYCYLRKNILNIEYFTSLYHSSSDLIPESDYVLENQKWSVNTSKLVFKQLLDLLDKRLTYLDENYFII